MEIQIGNKIISNTGKPYFIADIAANHDGSLERAFKLIELAKEAGAKLHLCHCSTKDSVEIRIFMQVLL